MSLHMPKVEIKFTEKQGKIVCSTVMDGSINVCALISTLAATHDALLRRLDSTSTDEATRLKLKIRELKLGVEDV